MLKISAVIPFYRLYSQKSFIQCVRNLLDSELALVVLVDDGSCGAYDGVLEEFKGKNKLHILKHAVLCGHGAAVKTGLNYVYCNHPDLIGAVVVNPHTPYASNEVLKLASTLQESPNAFVQGIKSNPKDSSKGAFLKSADALFTCVTGIKPGQIGLSICGIPREFIPKCLKIRSNHHEFDMDLVLLCKYNNIPIKEMALPWLDEENTFVAFNPMLYSMRIGFVLLRFIFVSMITAVIDLIIFLATYALFSNIALGMAVSRCVAMALNYRLIKRRVFYAKEKNYKIMCKYFLAVLFFGVISYFLIKTIQMNFAISVVTAKIMVESVLFFFNVLVQRDLVFVSNGQVEQTDWNLYYEKPYPSAKYTRKIMERQIITNLKNFTPSAAGSSTILELGGANSCFLEGLLGNIHPKEYTVVDNNEVGLRKLGQRLKDRSNVHLINANIFDLSMKESTDIAFSVGLIEHFTPEGTRRAIKAHFDAVKPGGIVLLTFPTSTWLYHCTRFIAELFGAWIFTDERPLHKTEVLDTVGSLGSVLNVKTIWPMFLTQTIVVAKKF
jgi:hypothetical protein